MARSTRDQILKSKDWDTKDIQVDGWGTVGIRSLSAKERLGLATEFSGDKLTNEKATEFYVRLVHMAVIDDNGDPVFSNGDAALLAERNWNRLETVANEIMSFNGMRETEEKAAVKN